MQNYNYILINDKLTAFILSLFRLVSKK